MPTFPYPNQRFTSNLGLSLFGMDEVLADNMNLIDAAYGAGSSVNVNGSLVTDPNFNGTTPAAPVGKTNVIWQVDVNGNVSAYATTSSSAAGSDTQVQYNKSGAFGADSSLIWNYTSSQLFIGGVSPTTSAALTIIGASAGSAASPLETHSSYANGIGMYTHSNTAFRAPSMSFFRSFGTQAAPTAVSSAGELGYLSFSGYDSSAYALGFELTAQTGTNWSTGNHNATLYFSACPAHSNSLSEVLRINSNADNGGDIDGTISWLNTYVANLGSIPNQGKFLGFLTSIYGPATGFQNPSQGTILVGNCTTGDFSATVKLQNLISSYITLSKISAPGAPVITTVGTAGSTTWTYVVVAKDVNGLVIASSSGSTTTGNATLSGTNYNVITISAPSTGAVSYDVYRTAVGTSPTTTGLIGNVTAAIQPGAYPVVLFPVFNDTGLSGNNAAVPANTVTSGINNAGTYKDSTGSVGTSGQLLSSTVTGTQWVASPSTPPGGSSGNIQYNNGSGGFGGSAATITSGGAITLPSTLTDGVSSVGTNGQVLSSTVTGVKWISLSSGGTVTNTLGSLTQYAVVIGNGGNDETVIGSLGTSGQVLTSGGAGVAPSWSSAPAGSWSSLTNASADLTLANAGFKTTFNQTSNIAWLWANTTTATSGTTNASPLLELAANYWTGAASAQDLWTVGSSLVAGTNGASTLTFTHTGSTGASPVLFSYAGTGTVPSIAVRQATQGISASTTSILNLICGVQGGSVQIGDTTSAKLQFTSAASPTIAPINAGNTLTLNSAIGSQNSAGVVLSTSNAGGFVNASGSQACVQSGGSFAPTSGTGNFFGILDSHVINQTGGANGTIRCLAAYPQNTAVVGTEYLLALGTTTAAGVGGTLTDKFLIDSTGSVKNYNGTATVRNGIAAEYASSDLTAQSAAITATTLLSAPQTGMYKVSWSATITTASDISSVLGGTNGFQVIYTSPTDSVAKTTVPGNSVTSSANTTGTAVGGVEVIYAKTGTNIQFSCGYTDSHTSTAMVYELHITVEAL